MKFGKREIKVAAPQVDWSENDAHTSRIVRERSARVYRRHLARIAAENNTPFARFKRWLNSEAF